MRAPTFIDLFCGCGGFSLGFVQAGFEHLTGIEIDGSACGSYTTNVGKVYHRDITTMYSGELMARIKQRPDIVLLSPPCEGFSEANPNRAGDHYDRLYNPPGSLTITAIDWICDLDPRVGFIMENVPAISMGPLRKHLEREFARIGYGKVYFNMIRAEALGSPSKRPRLFISNLPFQEPIEVPAVNRIYAGGSMEAVTREEGEAMDGEEDGISGAGNEPPCLAGETDASNETSWHGHVSVMDAIGDLPDPTAIHDIDDHALLGSHGKKDPSIGRLHWGESLVTFVAAGGKGKNSWIRLHPFKPAPIIMGKSVFVHPFDDRQITIRETARLQGFPDWYRFSGNIYEKRNQIGEAVCPLVSRYLAAEILQR